MKSIAEVLPQVVIDLKYASSDNFTGAALYDKSVTAMLSAPALDQLIQAHSILKSIDHNLEFVIWDAARPHSVQVALFEIVKGTYQEKYIAHPEQGSLHNYGCAIDLGLIRNGALLDMGTDYDYFGELAEPSKEIDFLHEGKLTQDALQNRLLLRYVMTAAGFQPIPHEWWHFNYCDLTTAKKLFLRWD